MTKYQKRHRIIATFFLLIFFPTLFPTNLFASTNGPVAPEATSFEPVDATDMVNLATGDLSYVMPLLNVPSPEGGYPLSLAYHAGIANDQDASWVGLGWSLNPGTINRSVSGYPDDWKQENILSMVYDSGGEIASHNYSVGVGWGNGKYSVGLYGSYSENKAFGGENSYNSEFGVYASDGILSGKIGSDGASLGYSLSYTGANRQSENSSTGESFKTNSSGSIGIKAVNYTGTHNSNSSQYNVRQVGDNVSVSINAYIFSLNYSFAKLRYHLFDTKKYIGIGTLYAKNITNARTNAIIEPVGFDTYIANYDQTDESLLKNNIVLPTYDYYSVSAQGISGDISPKIFEFGSLTPKTESVYVKGKKFHNYYHNKDPFTRSLSDDNIHFYFNNTYESYLSIDSDIWGTIPSSTNAAFDGVSSPSSSLNATATINGKNFSSYDSLKNRKKGGSYIETYTNQQIISDQSLIYKVSNFNRNNSYIPKDGIGAFKITTADGKTYHYTLPVYQKEKFARSSKYDEDINNKFKEEFQLAPYATHWLLTAITGSDFVDDGDGTINDKDLGYWVTFDYGKWSDGYTWRTPRGADFKTTPSSKIYEWGVKEIYYLNAVKTRTHTALFVKSERIDGKSIPENSEREFSNYGLAFDLCDKSSKDNLYYLKVFGTFPSVQLYGSSDARHNVKMKYNKEVHSLLKLDRIIVVKNENIPSNFKYSNPNENLPKITSSINITEYGGIGHGGGIDYEQGNMPVYNSSWSGELYNNVLDQKDINYYFPSIQNFSNRIIDFNYNYSLAKETPNGNGASTYGRLTLNKISFKGKNGNQVLPPYSFEYGNPDIPYNIKNSDDWGYNKVPEAWSLNKIIHPNGANILIKYEEDDYHTEAVNYEVKFKNELKFTFSEYSGKLRFIVENLDPNNTNKINFSSFYNINQTAIVNIWACIKHEYNDGGCQSRDANVNINDENVDVVAVSSDSVTFETTISGHTSNQNGGLGWLYGVTYSYEMDRLQFKERNQCPDLPGGCSSRTAHTLYYSINSNKIDKDKKGGGLRVKQVTVNADGHNQNTNYYYNQDGYGKNNTDSNYKSSGITSYSPSKYDKNLKYMAELPPPGVIYSTVSVETDLNINKYYFKTLSPEIENSEEYAVGDILNIKKAQHQDNIPITIVNYPNSTMSRYKYEIKNNFSMIGALLKQEKYNKSNQLLKKIENNYMPISDIVQGTVREAFTTYKSSYTPNYDLNRWDANFYLDVSSKTVYPAIIQNTKVFENGLVNTTSYDKFDFLTGQILETSTISSDGQSYKTKVIPAYIKYPEMGSKADNINNKNMLSQEAANYSYIFDKNDPVKPWKETGVGITTWSNIWEYRDIAGTSVNVAASAPSAQKIWRKHKTYVWNGVKDSNGIFQSYDSTNDGDDGFIWGVGLPQPGNSKWKQISEVTLYDHFSAALEMKDINGNFAATKMGDNETKVVTTGNAGYNEMFFAGAENITGTENTNALGTNWLEPEVKMINAKRTSSYYHTGKQAIQATNTSEFGVLLSGTPIDGKPQHRPGKYKVSVWVHKDNANQARIKDNGNIKNFTESYPAGNWVLKSAYVDVTAGDYPVYVTSADGSAVYFDDLMIRPVASSITGYVYNEWDELTHIIGNNGLATRFEYDAAGRLIKTYSEVIDDAANGIIGGFKQIKSTAYNNRYMQ